MGQDDVLKFLEKEKDWTTSKRISEGIGRSVSVVSTSLSQLLKYGEIQRRDVQKNLRYIKGGSKYEWKTK